MDGIGFCFPDAWVSSPYVTSSEVFKCVYALSSQLLASADWRARRSALTSMLVIMEYTADYFKPVLQPLSLQVRTLLRDPVPAVRRKAAFFFSETIDWCGSALQEAAPFLINDIQEAWLPASPHA